MRRRERGNEIFDCNPRPWSGVLSTTGGLVFGSSMEASFFALDAKTGKPLWDFQTGGPVRANPMSFATYGHQRIAMQQPAPSLSSAWIDVPWDIQALV